MAPNPNAAETAPGVSPYTVAMGRCLDKLGDRVEDRAVVHTLINLVQGRMLEYLADRICREYGITDAASMQRIVSVLLRIFSDEFFALFRSKVEARPQLVVKIARRIHRHEVHRDGASPGEVSLAADRLFSAIYRKYFEYSNLGTLLQMVESDAEIQKIVLLTLLRREVEDTELIKRITAILDADQDGAAPKLFMDYYAGGRTDRLAEKVRSGAWEADAEPLRRRMASLRGE